MNPYRVLTLCLKFENYPLLKGSDRSHIVSYTNVCKTAIRFCSSTVMEKTSPVLEPDEKVDLTNYGSRLPKNFNFAMIADKSPIVQKYIDLGVDLYKVQKNPKAANYLLTLNLEKLKSHLFFLTDNGVPSDKLGNFITENPTIFKEELDDLKVRITYLKSKKFDKNISHIITSYPKWLSIPVKKVDERLGYLQVTFDLSGNQVRHIITRAPSLVNVRKEIIMTNSYTLKEELGLDKHDLKKVIISEPQLLRVDSFNLVLTFEYLTKTMKVSKDLIINQPRTLNCRKFLLEERHKFLESLGRAQYSHLLPGYVDLLSLATLNDVEFCEKIAKTSVDVFNNFLKTF